jgi:nickel-dependent lactate racemase
MGMINVEVPGQEWHKDKLMKLEFPGDWRVHRCKMTCEEGKPITKAQIRKAIRNPLGTKPLVKLAEGKSEAVIIFDDSTRPTKAQYYAPIVLEEIKRAGVKDDCIRFIVAAGSHGTFGRRFFAKKLGEDIVDSYDVYNHNPYEMTQYVGETSHKTPLWVNSEVMACDLKIGIGTVLFHRMTGFSGGGKMICPGVSGIETIRYNHGVVGGFAPGLKPHSSTGYLKNDDNVLRLDMEECAKLAGLDFKIDTVLNLERRPLEVYAGDFVQTQRKASKGVLHWHSTESPTEMDIVVANCYMRQNEPQLGMWPAGFSVAEGGTIVLLANEPDGEISHWIFGSHGKHIGASLWSGKPRSLGRAARLILYGENRDRYLEKSFGSDASVTWIKNWDEVVEVLKTFHVGRPKVAVLPDATSGIPEDIIKSQ